MLKKIKRLVRFVVFVAAFMGGVAFERFRVERDLKSVADDKTLYVLWRGISNNYDVSVKTVQKK